jgi:hypothetical protein
MEFKVISGNVGQGTTSFVDNHPGTLNNIGPYSGSYRRRFGFSGIFMFAGKRLVRSEAS